MQSGWDLREKKKTGSELQLELRTSAGFIDVRFEDGARQGRSGSHSASTITILASNGDTTVALEWL